MSGSRATRSAVIPDVFGVILAGGRSSRMGRDKASLAYRAGTLTSHMAERLREAGIVRVLVSGYVVGFDCIADRAEGQGPLMGLSSVAEAVAGEARHLLVVPVDMPALTGGILRRLGLQTRHSVFGDFALPALLRNDAAFRAMLRERLALASRERSVHGLLDSLGATRLTLSAQEIPALVNINTREQWENFCAEEGR